MTFSPNQKQNNFQSDSPNPIRIQKEIEQAQKEVKTTGFLLRWFFILGGVLIVLFYSVLFWGLMGGNIDNPLFKLLGIGSGDLKNILLIFTNFVFGILSLIFFIQTLIKFFQWLIIEHSAENRKQFLVKSGIYFSVFIALIALWMFFFFLISNARSADDPRTLNEMIVTSPVSTVGLTSPVKVDFSFTNDLYKRIPKNLVQQISWDFDGDGKTDASGDHVSYRFLDKGRNDGRYTVMVQIHYLSSLTQEEKVLKLTRDVIIDKEAVIAMITVDKDSGPVPLKVKFSANSSRDPDGSIVSYEWDVNGNNDYAISGENQTEVEKTFTKVGEYTVRLRVTGSSGVTATAERTITAGNSENILAKISSDKGFQGMMPFNVTLDGNLSFSRFGKIVKYEWFIEGESQTFDGRIMKRVFEKPGDYTVYLTVTNENGESNRVSEVIHVVDNQVGTDVHIKTTPTPDKDNIVHGIAPLEVLFDSKMSTIRNVVERRWDFENDGVIDDYSDSVKHVYADPGEYLVKLTLVDSNDREFSQTQKVVVEGSGTVAKIQATPSAGIVPLSVQFDGSGSRTDDGKIVSYIWTFPGKDPVNYDAKVSYEFDTVGTYPVKLQVLTSTGKTATTTFYIAVRSHPLNADFIATPNKENPLQFTFDPTSSTGTIIQYLWDFGDGTTSTNVSPTHTYAFSALYTVSLKIIGLNGVISTVQKNLDLSEANLQNQKVKGVEAQ